ncbi:hypothetical protein [Leptospirillum ferrooxidans]|jgi:hypothetical protein|uniref:PilZ domain-containing protein n=1 Tax=Leptospirillum ferrooxidans (strain C2-3) TaxID=1162668 RepID=I0IR55_LEPFC|nr:hypothetical protein [Leptospirillum ferrooxidans]BAM07754.1 hypothetical protein LFE_2081 [Leptospirillum ferrooxidans C2-3]
MSEQFLFSSVSGVLDGDFPLAGVLGNLRVISSVSLSVANLAHDNDVSRQLLPSDIVVLAPSNWFMDDDRQPWLALFLAMEERMGRVESILERMSRGEPVSLPHSLEVILSERGVVFSDGNHYPPGSRLRLVMDLPSFPPSHLVLHALVRDLATFGTEIFDGRATLAEFAPMDPVSQETLIRYLVVKSRSEIRKSRL